MLYSELRRLQKNYTRLTPQGKSLVDRVTAIAPSPQVDRAKLDARFAQGFEPNQEEEAKAYSRIWLAERMDLGTDVDASGGVDYETLSNAYFGSAIKPIAAAKQIAETEVLPEKKEGEKQKPRLGDRLRYRESRMTPRGSSLASKLALQGDLSLSEWNAIPWSDREHVIPYAMMRAGTKDFTMVDHFRQVGNYFMETAQSMHDGIQLMFGFDPVKEGLLLQGFTNDLKAAENGRRRMKGALLGKKEKGFGEELITKTENVTTYMGLAAVTLGMAPFFQFTNDFRNRLVDAGIEKEAALNLASLTAMPYVLIENMKIGTAIKGTKVGQKLMAKMGTKLLSIAGKKTIAGRIAAAMQTRAFDFAYRRATGVFTEVVVEEGSQQLLEEVVFGAMIDEFGEFDGAAVIEAVKQSLGPMGLLQAIAGGGELALTKGQLYNWDKTQKALGYTPRSEQKEEVSQLESIPPAVLQAVEAAETQEEAIEALRGLGYGPEVLPQLEATLDVEREDAQVAVEQAQADMERELAANEAGETALRPEAQAAETEAPAPKAGESLTIEQMEAAGRKIPAGADVQMARQEALQAELAKYPSLEGVTVEIVDAITRPEQTDAEGNVTAPAATAKGASFGDVIRVAMGRSGQQETARHEIYHQLSANGVVSPAELEVLLQKDAEWKKTYGIDALYEADTEAVQAEEAQANRFADLSEEERGIVQKVQDFFRAIRNWAKGLGFRTADDVIAALRDGGGDAAGQAEAGAGDGPARFSLDGPDSPQLRDASVVLAADIAQGKTVTVADAGALLPENLRDRAQEVFDRADDLADRLAEKMEGAQFDEKMMGVLREAEIRSYYQDLIERISGGEFRRGEMTERARKRVAERQQAALDARQGSTVEELSEAGFSPVDELKAILPKTKRPKKPPAAEPAPEEDADTVDVTTEADSTTEGDAEGGKAEAPPPAPIDPQKWEAYTQKLKDALLATMPEGTTEQSPEFLADYRATLRTVLDEATSELLPSYRREAARLRLQRISGYRKLDALENAAQSLADRINSERVRQSKTALLKRVGKFVNARFLKGRESATKERIKKKISSAARRWLRLAKTVIKSKTAEEDREKLQNYINHPGTALGPNETEETYRAELEKKYKGLNDKAYKALPMQELALLLHKSLFDFGGLRERSIGDISDAIEKLRVATVEGKAEIETAIEEREERIAPYRDSLQEALNVAEGKKTPGIKGGSFGITPMSILGKMRDVTRFGVQAAIKASRDMAIAWNDKIQKAQTQEEAEVRNVTTEFHKALRGIFKRDPVNVVLGLVKERDRYKHLSRNGDTRLSKGNLIQIYMGAIQDDYATQAKDYDLKAILREFTPEDIKLIEWLWGYDQRSLAPISDVSKKVTGLDLVSTGPKHWFGAIQRNEGGLAEVHQVSTIVPPSTTNRRKHSLPFDETADVIGVFYSRLNEFAHYKAFAELSADLRGIFGPKDFQNKVRDVHGKKYLSQFLQHVTVVINGRVMSGSITPWMQNMLDKFRGLAALSAFAGNIRVLAGQTTSIPAFALELAHRSEGTVSGAIAQFFSPAGWDAMWTIIKSEQLKNRFSTGSFEAMTNAMANKNPHLLGRALQKLMITVSIGDAVPMLLVGPGMYLNRYKQNIATGMEEEAAKADALNHLWSVVEETQQSSSLKNRAAWFRQGPMWSAVAQFSSTTAQFLNYEMQAVRDAQAGVEGSKKRLAETLILNHLILPGVYNIAKAIYSTQVLGDEWDEDDVWTLVVSMIMGPWSGLIIAGGIAETLLKVALTGKRSWLKKGIPAVANTVGYAEALGGLINAAWNLDAGAMQEELDRGLRRANAPYRDVRKAIENRR